MMMKTRGFSLLLLLALSSIAAMGTAQSACAAEAPPFSGKWQVQGTHHVATIEIHGARATLVIPATRYHLDALVVGPKLIVVESGPAGWGSKQDGSDAVSGHQDLEGYGGYVATFDANNKIDYQGYNHLRIRFNHMAIFVPFTDDPMTEILPPGSTDDKDKPFRPDIELTRIQ